MHARGLTNLVGWIPTRYVCQSRVQARELLPHMISLLERGHRMAAKHGPAIQGASGDGHTYRLADGLNGLGLSESEALSVMDAWNATCDPPWSEPALKAKIQSAFKHTDRRGRLLKEDDERRWQHAIQSVSAPRKTDAEASEYLANVKHYPVTEHDAACIRNLRHLPPFNLQRLIELGFVTTIYVPDREYNCRHRCFAMCEDGFIQARRYDGGLLPANGERKKAKTLFGSRGVFYGKSLLKRFQKWGQHPVLMVEGVVGFLEAAGLIEYAEGLRGDALPWLPFAAVTAGSAFANDREAIELLRERRVLILPDEGSAGMKGAATWLAELESVGARVDVVSLPEVNNDLAPILKDPERYASTINSLFA